MSFGITAAIAGGAILGGILAPDAPDTSGMNRAAENNSAISGRMQDLAEKQYADQKALLEEFKPMLKQQVETALAAEGKSTQRSDDAWNDYNATWKPVEQKLAKESVAWGSTGRVEQNAQRAAGEVADQFDSARTQNREAMLRSGLDPAAIASLEASGRLEEAKAKGGAADSARRDTELQGLSLLENAARFGRNMPSTGLETARLAGAQSQQAQGGYGTLQSATGAPAASAAPLFAGAVSANNSAGNLFGDAAQLDFRGSLAKNQSVFGGMTAGARLAGMGKP